MDINKLENFFKKELTTELKDVLMINDGQNNYELFGKYYISPTSTGYFKVSLKSTHDTYEFANHFVFVLVFLVYANYFFLDYTFNV